MMADRLLLYLIAAVAALAAVLGFGWWCYDKGYSRADASHKAAAELLEKQYIRRVSTLNGEVAALNQRVGELKEELARKPKTRVVEITRERPFDPATCRIDDAAFGVLDDEARRTLDRGRAAGGRVPAARPGG